MSPGLDNVFRHIRLCREVVEFPSICEKYAWCGIWIVVYATQICGFYETYSAVYFPHLRLRSHMRKVALCGRKLHICVKKLRMQNIKMRNGRICDQKSVAYAKIGRKWTFTFYISGRIVAAVCGRFFRSAYIFGRYAYLIRICDRSYFLNAYIPKHS